MYLSIQQQAIKASQIKLNPPVFMQHARIPTDAPTAGHTHKPQPDLVVCVSELPTGEYCVRHLPLWLALLIRFKAQDLNKCPHTEQTHIFIFINRLSTTVTPLRVTMFNIRLYVLVISDLRYVLCQEIKLPCSPVKDRQHISRLTEKCKQVKGEVFSNHLNCFCNNVSCQTGQKDHSLATLLSLYSAASINRSQIRVSI